MSAHVERAVPVDLIDIGDRLRPADEAYVEIQAASMAASGQIEDIEIRPHPTAQGRFVLTAGLHRLLAARRLEWSTINASVVSRTEEQARLVEIDENLMRRELGALDRAIFLAERKKVWERLYPETAHGGDRKSLKSQGRNQTAKLATRFSADVAERTGLSERSVRRSVSLVASLSPKALQLARGTYLANHAADLQALAELDPEEQAAAVSRLAAGQIKRLADLRPRDKLPADEAQLRALHEAWKRASTKARRRFMREVGHAPSAKAHLEVVTSDEDVA